MILSKYKPADRKNASRKDEKKKNDIANKKVKPILPEGYQAKER